MPPLREPAAILKSELDFVINLFGGRVCSAFQAGPAARRSKNLHAAYYEQARQAYAVVQTGDARPYGNFILRKGVLNAGPLPR